MMNFVMITRKTVKKLNIVPETLSIESKGVETAFPNILSSSTSYQSIANRERRKQNRKSLAIKNIFSTDFFDGNSTDNETVYCGFEINELCNKRSSCLTNTTSENDSVINSKKVRKFSRLPKPRTSTEPCEVKFKFNRNVCTFSVNYNPSKVLSNLESASDQSQLNNGGLQTTETEKNQLNNEGENINEIGNIVTTKQSQLNNETAKIGETEENLAAKQNQLNNEEEKINEIGNIVTTRQCQLSSQRVEISKIEKKLTTRQSQLNNERVEISEIRKIGSTRQNQLNNETTKIGESEKNLATRQNQLNNEGEKINEIGNIATTRQSQLSNDVVEISDFEKILTARQSQLNNEGVEIGEIEKYSATRQNQLNNERIEVSEIKKIATTRQNQLNNEEEKISEIGNIVTTRQSQLSSERVEISKIEKKLTTRQSQLNNERVEISEIRKIGTTRQNQLNNEGMNISEIEKKLTTDQSELKNERVGINEIRKNSTTRQNQLNNEGAQIAKIEEICTTGQCELNNEGAEITEIRKISTTRQNQLNNKETEIAEIEDTLTTRQNQLNNEGAEVSKIEEILTTEQSELKNEGVEITEIREITTTRQNRLNNEEAEIAEIEETLTTNQRQLNNEGKEVSEIKEILNTNQSQLNNEGVETSEIRKICTTRQDQLDNEVSNEAEVSKIEETLTADQIELNNEGVDISKIELITTNQSQLNNEGKQISETTGQNPPLKNIGEVSNKPMLQSDSLTNTNLLNTTLQKCDDTNNLSKIQSGSLSENNMVNTCTNNEEAANKNDLLSKSEPTNRIRSKKKWKNTLIPDAMKRKSKYINKINRAASFSKHKKSQLENKTHKINENTVSDLPKIENCNNMHQKVVDTQPEKGDTLKKLDDSVSDPETKINQSTIQRDIIESSETIEEILNVIPTNIVCLSPNSSDAQNNKNFDSINSSNNTAVAIDVANSKNLSCNDIKESEMTENNNMNCRELKSLNKDASISNVTTNNTSSLKNKQIIESKTILSKLTKNRDNKTNQKPSENSKSVKKICEPNLKGIYITKKLPEKETCPSSEKSKTGISRIPKWRSMTLPPVSKRNNATINKNKLENTRPKTEPNPRTSKIVDQAAQTIATEIVKTIEIKDAAENTDIINNQIKRRNVNNNKVIKVSKINAKKRPTVCEEDTTAKRPRTDSDERRFPSTALTKPTISSMNKQTSRYGTTIDNKFHINSQKRKGKGPVKILAFSRKSFASKKNSINRERPIDIVSPKQRRGKFEAEPYKGLGNEEKKTTFQSENIFQQFRNVLCARRSRKQGLLRMPVVERKTNVPRETAATDENKKTTHDLTAEKPDSKINETNVLNNFQNKSSKINLINPKGYCDSATQSICPINRHVKRIRQPFSKFYYPLWYTIKRRKFKGKERKRDSKIRSLTTISSKDLPSVGQANSSHSTIYQKTHSSKENLALPNNKLGDKFSCDCIKIDKSEKEINKIKDIKLSDNSESEYVDEALESDDKETSDVTQGAKNRHKLKQHEISTDNGLLTKALEELKRYIESMVTKGLDERQRKTNEPKHTNEEQLLEINSDEMFKKALNTLHNSERKYIKVNIEDQSSITDGYTTSLSSFSKSQSQTTLSITGSYKSLNNTERDNEFKLSFSSEKVRELIKKSCRTVSRIPVPLNTRRSNSEQNLRVICPNRFSKVSSSSTHSISSACAKHNPSMMCCNQLDTCSVFLFEVARHSREWSKWVRQIFSGINKFTSFVKEMKDDDAKLDEFYLNEWRDFTAMVDKMLASWRQYSREVKKVTEHAIRKFKRIDDRCCPKCLEDGIISDRTMMREVAKKLIDAITTAELWRTWLDDIMKQASLLVDIQPSHKHQLNVVDYSKHTYDDMVQTFSQIAFCIGEASRVIQKIDISELNK
ncbi:uncharacterized protein MAL13P1.304-like isoform X2 [Agrilus planipennis]|uniref:Uncharacterized protein MAL13P1.304-like isoform X2 n=1 Tax=Agrilus planipennis TaxID=224129 RepID=A0A1W4X6E2_AGRPL|nr:uncharacterized protein MAL13P1.304-like isoform X2 [Agrilus planipennis]